VLSRLMLDTITGWLGGRVWQPPRERRQLKHRAEADSRIVPTHPELARLLRVHLDRLGTATDKITKVSHRRRSQALNCDSEE
jgi:hypothetical protein